MRLTTRASSYVCLPCQLSRTRRVHRTINIHLSSIVYGSLHRSRSFTIQTRQRSEADTENKRYSEPSESSPTIRYSASKENLFRKLYSQPSDTTDVSRNFTARNFTTSAHETIELSESQQLELREAQILRQRLSEGLSSVPAIKQDPSLGDGIHIDQLLRTLPRKGHSPVQQRLIQRLGAEFRGQSFGSVRDDLDLATFHGDPSRRTVTDPRAKDVLKRLGVIGVGVKSTAGDKPSEPPSETVFHSPDLENVKISRGRRRRPLAELVTPQQTALKKSSKKETAKQSSPQPTFPLQKPNTQTVEAQNLFNASIDVPDQPALPQLSFDLSRVLFNPGTVYPLQDAYSRVYNFDPYLEKIMPITEFNFDALNPYLTSSEDEQLIALAKENDKRYIGSSSSMTSTLSQFHFLISQWRELNLDNFSRGFGEYNRAFTVINRSPSAIFLRYRDGVYAVDADKEYDEPNILMSLGKSMEKLLTLEKDDFEKWRRSNAGRSEPLEQNPDTFHYSEQGRFLLRSQLDACDPRLPGTGYFDLKTRAVVAVRFNLRDHEAGKDYEIKERYGNWESYEREQYDMMRSTYLKYSLQARMGHMEGIFVAYHNTSRIFGFQYVPISDMDVALHGQRDPSLGDQEYRFSVHFMEEVFNLGTSAYPEKSLRIHFDTRESSVTEEKPFMNIFIEPISEDEIQAIQSSQKAQFEAFEQRTLRGEVTGTTSNEDALVDANIVEGTDDNMNIIQDEQSPSSPLPVNDSAPVADVLQSDAANTEYLDRVLNTPRTGNRAFVKASPFDKEVIALKLTIQNKINDRNVSRVADISSSTRWSIDYKLERRGDEEARRMYRICKNRRTSALNSAISRSPDEPYIRQLRVLSEKGAEWRKQQDELDAQRERIVLYGDRL